MNVVLVMVLQSHGLMIRLKLDPLTPRSERCLCLGLQQKPTV